MTTRRAGRAKRRNPLESSAVAVSETEVIDRGRVFRNRKGTEKGSGLFVWRGEEQKRGQDSLFGVAGEPLECAAPLVLSSPKRHRFDS